MPKRPKSVLSVARTSTEYLAYFWMRVTVADGCWLWTGNVAGSGYGCIPTGRTNVQEYAHRFAWMLHHGPIPDGLFVCHHCDNPLCVNPSHLFLGTNADNVRDMMLKGRHHHPARGCKGCGGPLVATGCRACTVARRIARARTKERAMAPALTREQVATLPERWARIVVAYYGLCGAVRQDQEGIAAEHGITRQRVSQIVTAAFRRLGVERPHLPCHYPGLFSLTDSAA
jgi:hypothetical protein